MLQNVVLDGNPLNEDEGMRLLTCVVLDGNSPDEVILDLMNLLDDVNLMSTEGNDGRNDSMCQIYDKKSMSQCIRVFVQEKSRMHAGNNVPSRVWEKALIKCKTWDIHHGIDPLYWAMIRPNDPVQDYHRK